MNRLKNKYLNSGKAALAVMGGPSILENKISLGLIDKEKYTVFLESKALTPKFLGYGLEPDYFLMFFPEKCKTNALQSFIYRSFLAQFDIQPLLKPEYFDVFKDMKENFDTYFESWRPHRGPHKRYRLRPGVYLKDSPYDLIYRIPRTKIIANRELLMEYFPDFNHPNELYFFEQEKDSGIFDIERYYNPIEQSGKIILRDNSFINSAAIALYPLLYFMGFRKVYFLGMDMSMLGSMEYASLYTFKSMRHFGKFFKKAIPVFNACFKKNRKKFMRPPYEFDDMRKIVSYNKIEFVNIYEPFEFALPLEGIRNITFEEFINE